MLVTVFNKNTSHYEKVGEGKALPHLRQPFSGIEQLHEVAPLFRDPLRVTGEELAHDIGASFVLAKNKTLQRLQDKSEEEASNGDTITDYVRGSIMIGHWKQVEALRKLIEPTEGGDAIEIAGNRLIYYVDNFAEPLKNGMRRVMQKYDIAANDNAGHHVGEIQARVAAMQDAEALTHRIYRMKRDFNRFAAKFSATDYRLAHRMALLAGYCGDLIKPIHDLEAMRHGYDVLLTIPYDRAMAPNPNNPILKILMREHDAAAQLQPILKMAHDPKMTAKTYIIG
ncbi:MAG TPA: hypothetical protein VL625_05060 [Patescibacteria group bacterium]|jgi:hypothetical protein|nr:hypothetical protein [Patescibacteria group bacterium]